jgi:hypothetical protein
MMAKRNKVEVNVGDVFQIAIDDARIGYGQIVAKPEKPILFICVYAMTTRPGESPNIDEIVQSDILLAGNTFDALLNHGHWKIVGNVTSNLPSIALPVYKSGMGETAIVETLDRSRRRRATVAEENSLPFRDYAAPILFEDALKAIAGVSAWMSDYDDLQYEPLRRSSEVVV